MDTGSQLAAYRLFNRSSVQQPDKENDVDMTDPTTLTAVGAVATAGAAAIGKLWATVVEHHTDVKRALAHCEEEHEKARNKIELLGDGMATLKSEVGHLKGRMEGFQESEDRRTEKEKKPST